MKLVKAASVVVMLAGAVVLAIVAAPAVYTSFDGAQGADSAQSRAERQARDRVLDLRGPSLGITVRDVDPSDAGKQKPPGGVLVDDVEANTPAEKAGLKAGDVIVQFDGEAVKSARQFTRLVREAAPGRTVTATIVRDGRRTDVRITPDERRLDLLPGDFGDYMREFGLEMGRLGDRIEPFAFDFDFGVSARRLGVTVQELTPQLADFFGAREGVLVTSVVEGSPAERAGMKAGDVITAVNGAAVRSRGDVVRALRDGRSDQEAAIAIVRDKKPTTLTVKIERRRMTRARPA